MLLTVQLRYSKQLSPRSAECSLPESTRNERVIGGRVSEGENARYRGGRRGNETPHRGRLARGLAPKPGNVPDGKRPGTTILDDRLSDSVG